MATNTAIDIEYVANLLSATLQPKHQREAYSALQQEEVKPQFSLALLQLAHSNDRPGDTRLAAALYFKNFIKFNYVDDDGAHKLPAEEVEVLKRELLGIMIASPANIQAQLVAAITIIAASDWYEKWEKLLEDLVGRLSENDFKVTNSVLTLAHGVLMSLRHQFESSEVKAKVVHAIDNLEKPLRYYLLVADKRIEENMNNPTQLEGWFETLKLLVEILHDLSTIDLPDAIVENRAAICSVLYKYLPYRNPILDGDKDEATVIDTAKASIYDVLGLWFEKYASDFHEEADKWVIRVTWELLSTTGPEMGRDILVSKALKFITKAAAASPCHANECKAEKDGKLTNELSPVASAVIMSNMRLRDSDMELFQDEPIEFIRRDLEGYDTDSRRKAATDLSRTLMGKLSSNATGDVLAQIDQTMAQTDWRDRDAALNLYLAIAANGAVTATKGVISVNPIISSDARFEVVPFFRARVLSDLTDDKAEPISRVNAIKYLHNFRGQIMNQHAKDVLEMLISLTKAKDYVVYTYAAITVERALSLTDDNGKPVVDASIVRPRAKELLDNLLALIAKESSSAAKMQENEFVMRCIMRVLIIIKDGVNDTVNGAESVLTVVLGQLIGITNTIKENPSNPRFYYFLFEAIGALVRYCDPSKAGALEQALWEPLSSILVKDVTEFVPYVFQLFAAVIEASSTGAVPENLKELFTLLVQTARWENQGNINQGSIPASTRFLCAIIPRLSDTIAQGGQLVPVLGVFQRLLNTSKYYQQSFDILEVVSASLPSAALDPYFPEILRLLFMRLVNPKCPPPLKKLFARFYHLISGLGTEAGLGADFFARHAEAVQAGSFAGQFGLYGHVIIPMSKQFVKTEDLKVRRISCKMAAVSYTKTLCDSRLFLEKYLAEWKVTCDSLLELASNKFEVVSKSDETIMEADPDDVGFGVGFTPLKTCSREPQDYFPEVTDISALLEAVRARHGDKLSIIESDRAERLSRLAREEAMNKV